MKKRSMYGRYLPWYFLRKALFIMKLTTLLLLITAFSLMAGESYSQDKRISLNMKDVLIKDVLLKIENTSEYFFIYNNQLIDVDRKVTVNADNEKITDILNRIFQGQKVDFQVTERKIIIAPIESAETQMQKSVSGKVTDSTGGPLPGVSVVIKGTTNGTITDSDGNYKLSVPSANAILQFSFVGMKAQEIRVADKNIINISLKEESVGLEEVVAVGYGVQKKVNVIGSISKVSSERLEGRPVPLLSNALAGQMTGVTVITRSGAPGSESTINVRGVGSFGAKPDALVLIDGIPGSINDVRPEEVESISVLKDASSAAIYGARAANGVILISTKAGKPNKVKVNYNAYGGFVTPTSLPQMVNSWDYAQAYNEASGTDRYSAEDISKFKEGKDLVNYPNSNMLKEVFSRKGFQTGHDLTLTGGNEYNQYYLAVGYLSQNGIIEKNNLDLYNARLNMTTKLTNSLKLVTRIYGSSSKLNEPAVPGGKDVKRMTGGVVLNSVRYPSVYSIILPNGDYGVGPELYGTPPAWVKSQSFYQNPIWKFGSNANLTYTPIKCLSISAIGGYNFIYNEDRLYRSTLRLNDNVTLSPSSLEQESKRTQYQTFQATADYNQNFEGHQLGLLVGYSFEKENYRDMTGSRDKFPGNDLPFLSAGSPSNQNVKGEGYDWAIQSYFGRVRYNYKEKYLFESTVRYDGSSRFPTTLKYGFFPSFAGGWRISEESFFKNKFPWISNLKLKASWGKLGNQNIGNYPWQSTYELGQDYVFGDVINLGAAQTTLTDSKLHWESTYTADGGLESSFWNGKLTVNISYFHRKTTDILYKPTSSVSTVLGMKLSEMNTGSLKNNGIEIELGHRAKLGMFTYHVNGNFTYIRNRVLDLGVGNVKQPNGLIGNGSDLFIGYPMQLYYGLVTDGVFLDQADIDAWYQQNDQSAINPKANAKPGDVRYVDLNGDHKVDLSHDRKVLGSRIPKYTFMFNLGFEVKGFDFNAMLQGVAGVSGLLNGYCGFAFYNLGNIQEWMWKGRFNPEKPTRYPAYPRLQILGNSAGVNGQLSNFWVLNASYLRVKNIQVGYTFPSALTRNIHVEGVRIYASVENPFTFDHYRKGWDPEINSSGDFYPILSTYTLGFNIKF